MKSQAGCEETLADVIKRELLARGFVEVEPNPLGGGLWNHPDWDDGVDNIAQAVIHAFNEEY